MFLHLHKAAKWFLLLTLPLTILPIFLGTLSGILFPIFLNRHITTNTEHYLRDIKSAASDWGVGGSAPSFRQFQDSKNDFNLVRINSNDWVQKLGYILPIEYSDWNTIISQDTPIDKQASLETLMWEKKKKNNKAKPQPRDQWLFLTHYSWLDFDGWNSAFDSLLRHAYTNPILNSTTFHFAECSTTASFLCGVWNTRPPALLHFHIEEESPEEEEEEEALDPDLSYPVPYNQLLPVTVHLIELPLQESHPGLPWTKFPTPELQILTTITRKESIISQIPPYNPSEYLQRRYNEYLTHLLSTPHTFLSQISSLDDFLIHNLNQPLGIQSATDILYSLSYDLSLITSTIINNFLIQPTRELINEFLGTPKAGDVIFADMDDDNQEEEEEDGDIFGFGRIMEKVLADAEKAKSLAGREAKGGGIATGPPPETTHMDHDARL